MAYGVNARRGCRESIESLRRHCPGLSVRVIGERAKGARCIEFESTDSSGRWAKLNLDSISPFEQTLYLDADTRVHGDLSAGFRILEDGYDLVIAPSTKQGADVMGHANGEDRRATFDAVGCIEPLGLQAGVFYFARNSRTLALFAAWREEWERFRYLDQPALIRALHRAPVRLWLLSNEFNGGSVVEHLFGRARA